MKTTKTERRETEFLPEDVKQGVELIKSHVGHMSTPLLGTVLLTCLVEASKHDALQSEDYAKAVAEAENPQDISWGGGSIALNVDGYDVNVEIRLSKRAALLQVLKQMQADGKDPVAELLGGILASADKLDS